MDSRIPELKNYGILYFYGIGRKGSEEAGFTQFLTHKSTLLSSTSWHFEIFGYA